MSTVAAPISSELLGRFRNGDERALELLFREQYDSLTELATDEAGEAIVAPHVLEDAFADAWEARDRIATPEGLESFLRDAVHQHAKRQRSRRAAIHRLHQHERHTNHASATPSSVDDAWARLHSLLHPAVADPSQSARLRAAVARHDTAAHMKTIAKGRPWGTIILVAVLALAVMGGGGLWLRNASQAIRVERVFVGTDVRDLSTNSGERARITLMDGTKTDLAADTKLVVPNAFARVRAVKLANGGAASFVVAPGLDIPFRVLAGNAKVTATGTTLDVSLLPAPGTVVVRVREGSAEVAVGEKTQVVSAGQAIAVGPDSTIAPASATLVEESLGWLDDKLVVAGRPVRTVLPLLDRWFRIRVNVGDSAALARVATLRVGLDDPRSAVDSLEASAAVRLEWEGKTLVLRDGAAPATKK